MVDRNRSKGGSSAFFRGAAGMKRTEEELQLAKQREAERKARMDGPRMPFRFRIPAGETTEIIICDDAPDFFMYEHNLKDKDGRWGLFTGCTKVFDECPICEATGKESHYVLMLTCIDLTQYTDSNGKKVKFSRKLLPVKPAQQKKFLRLYEKYGSLRGMVLEMTRDGDKDSSIGNDIEYIETLDEDAMAEYVRTFKDREGKTHTEECHEVLEYEKLFVEPTTESLRKIVGGKPLAGSRDADREELGSRSSRSARGARGKQEEEEFEDDDDTRSFGRGRRGRAAPAEEEEDDDPPAPARGRRGRAAPVEEEEDDPPAPTRGRRGRAAPVDDDDPPFDADPPARGARRGRAAPVEEEDDDPPAPARGRRGRVERTEPEEEDDDPPARTTRRPRR